MEPQELGHGVQDANGDPMEAGGKDLDDSEGREAVGNNAEDFAVQRGVAAVAGPAYSR